MSMVVDYYKQKANPFLSDLNTKINSFFGAKYSKIETSRWACVAIICTLGVYALVQTYRFQNALSSGDIKTAQEALSLGAIKYTTGKKIFNLAQKNQIESIKLLVAQINTFNKIVEGQGNRSLDISWLRYAEPSAEAFISARDDHQEGQNEILLQILPNALVDRTRLYAVYANNYAGTNDIVSQEYEGQQRRYFPDMKKNDWWSEPHEALVPQFMKV